MMANYRQLKHPCYVTLGDNHHTNSLNPDPSLKVIGQGGTWVKITEWTVTAPTPHSNSENELAIV